MARVNPPAHPPEELPHTLLWRWRRNPLRRRTDLAQGLIAVGLFLAVLAATPAAMFLIGDTAYRHHKETARHQAATWPHTPAVLVHDAPRHPEPGSYEAKKTLYPATVRFTDPHGHTRTAKTDVEPALAAGSTVHVWVNDEGKITDPPLTTEQVRNRTMVYAVLAALAVPLLGAAAYSYATAGWSSTTSPSGTQPGPMSPPYMSAQTSIIREGPNRDFYLKKRGEGCKHVQAVIALARRRASVLWALLRDDREFTSAPPAAQAA